MKNVEKRLKRSMPWLRPILRVFHLLLRRMCLLLRENAKLRRSRGKEEAMQKQEAFLLRQIW